VDHPVSSGAELSIWRRGLVLAAFASHALPDPVHHGGRLAAPVLREGY
jgi:hypothetical protein